MARRIDIELTSKRDDDTWTWRAAGAREPRGTVDSKLLPAKSKVGDNHKVEIEGFLDGLTIVAVIAPKKAVRTEPERIELLTPRSEGSLVTTHLARKPRREDDRRGGARRRDERGGDSRGGDRDRRGPRSDRGDRGERGARDGRDRDRDRGGDRGDRGDRHRDRPSTPPPDAKPKPKRLRPARVHRAALLESLPAEQRPIAEQLVQGGIPAVRQAIEKQNEELKAEGKTQVAAQPLLEIAEKLRNRAQAAVWRDRADAALASVDELDLRDLRSVVNAADDAGRDQEARAVADQLREALINRVEKEQSAWVAEVAENLHEGRVVRALRLSSRPPKAGSPLPGNLAEQLITVTNEALTAETGPQRWATVLDALAYSPIRRRVVPDSLPEKLPADLRELIAKLGSRLPEIAHIFAIKPSDAPARPRPPRRKPGGPGARGDGAPGAGGGRKPRNKPQPEAKSSKPGSEAEPKPKAEDTTTETPAPEAEAPQPDAETQPAAEATTAEAEAVTPEAEAATAEVEPTTAEAEAITPEVVAATAEVEAATAETAVADPEPEAAEAEASVAAPEVEAEDTATVPTPDAPQADAEPEAAAAPEDAPTEDTPEAEHKADDADDGEPATELAAEAEATASA
ncbi:MAG TPA: hypothetical protein VK611_12640 [Acidimicrobiales bacterium]|nr:hypothetical protein [Acidimicrobiales bacterium]